MRTICSNLVAICCALLSVQVAWSVDPVTYNKDILPLLAEHCFVCHGFDKTTRQAGLRLDRADSAEQPLADGARAIVPGSPADSQLIRRINSDDADQRMPPPGARRGLNQREIELLTRWISEGARYEPHWAFVPPKVESIQFEKVTGRDYGSSPIDELLLREQPTEVATSDEPTSGLQDGSARRVGALNPPAERTTLIRRVLLDLTGLPPTSDAVRAFVEDRRDDAYERLVDRTLNSAGFGQRWARWWLDLAHYADSDGYLQDFLRPNAWHYRDWVINALNEDMPFDQFTVYQLAGDLLADQRDRAGGTFDINRSDPISQQLRIATGFLRNTLSNREGGADLEEYRVRQAIDRTATVASTWLGLTIGCAECHDHKYDPITQVEFYQFYALMNNLDEVNVDLVATQSERETQAMHDAAYRWRQERLAGVAEQLEQLQLAWEAKLMWTEQNPGADHRWDRNLEVLGLIWGQGEGEGQLEGINIIKTPPAARSTSQQARLQNYFLKHGSPIDPAAFKRLGLDALGSEIQKHFERLPKLPRAQTVVTAVRPRTTYLHTRGDFRRPGAAVRADVPSSVGSKNQPVDDRLKLAEWITSAEHPLTARVVVNRLWQELFGRGLVATSENLGVRGSPPSHPLLLDWLALHLVQHQWSLKSIIREIVMSDAYKQSSTATVWPVSDDRQNVRILRQSRLRMSAESVRDAMLFWGGLIDLRAGGPAVRPPQPDSVALEGFDNKWLADQGADRYRRGLYTFLQRTSPFAQSITFDLPDTSRSCSRRERSNTPLQALTLLNDPVLFEAALGAAGLALSQAPQSGNDPDAKRIEEMFLSILGRWPTGVEMSRLVEHLEHQRKIYREDAASCDKLLSNWPLTGNVAKSELVAWAMTASVLMNLDEAITRN